ncbi:MAG: hypothetical protein ACI88C_000045 [Acidimicrobiales bacterium]|jgi:hypothetical protein
MAYSRGEINGAIKAGPLFRDLQLAYVLYDTGWTKDEFDALPTRIKKFSRMISMSERMKPRLL